MDFGGHFRTISYNILEYTNIRKEPVVTAKDR